MGIWVTDEMLHQEVQRFCRRSLCHKGLTSHAGPLESRRRLGKRHMTGILPNNDHYPPLWHFAIALDKGQWLWEPPSSSSARREQRGRWSLKGLGKRFLAWLEDAHLDEPFLQAPRAMTFDQQDTAEFICQALREQLSTMTQASTGDLDAVVLSCQDALRERILRGQWTREDVLAAMNPLGKQTEYGWAHLRRCQRIEGAIRETVVFAMAAASRSNESAFSLELWHTLSENISSSVANSRKIQLYRHLLRNIPVAVRTTLPLEQLATFFGSVLERYALKHHLSKNWFRDMIRLHHALRSLAAPQLEALYATMESWLNSRDPGLQSTHNLRYAVFLLQTLGKTEADFDIAELHRRYCTTDGLLSSTQLWQFVMAELVANQTVDAVMRRLLTTTHDESTSPSEMWTRLITHMAAAKLTPHLVRLLRDVNALGLVVGVLSTPPCGASQVTALAALTQADGGREVFDTWKRNLTSRRRSDHTAGVLPWSNADDASYEHLIRNPSTEPYVSELLKSIPGCVTDSTSTLDAQAQLFSKMGFWYLTTTHLNDRQLLKRLTRLLSLQRCLTRRTSPEMVYPLIQVITRDLERGQPGRQTRLKWLVKLVEEAQGRDAASTAGGALERWRLTNVRRVDQRGVRPGREEGDDGFEWAMQQGRRTL